MDRLNRWMLGAFTPVMLAACAPKATATGGSGGSGAGTATEGTTAGSAASGTASGTGGDGCAAWNDEPTPAEAPLKVRLRNGTTDVLYLPLFPSPCASDPSPYEIEDLDPEGTGYWPYDACTFTCQDFMNDECGICSVEGLCPEGPMIRLEASGVYESTWDRRLMTTDVLPAACVQGTSCDPGPCQVLRQAGPGNYRVTAFFLAEPQACQDDPASCACTPNADGWCETEAVYSGDMPITKEKEFVLPGTDLVEISFVWLP